MDLIRRCSPNPQRLASPPLGGLERGTERLRDLQMVVQWEGGDTISTALLSIFPDLTPLYREVG